MAVSQMLSLNSLGTTFPLIQQLRNLYHQAIDEHDWKDGKCVFHSMTVCSCGKCQDRNAHDYPGREYCTRNKLTYPFHKLAYEIEIEHRASMADSLVHHQLKRGHSNWMEASHNVFISFRNKHIQMERLHYHLSTDVAVLQANLTYA